MKLDFYSTLTLIGMFHGVILSISLLRAKSNKNSNRWLSLLTLVFTLSGFYYILPLGLYKYIPHLIGLHLPLMYVIGPICFFYTSELVGDKSDNKKLHFIPLLIILIVMLPFFLKSTDSKEEILLSYNSGQGSLFGRAVFFLSLLHITIYLIYSFKALYLYGKSIRENYSNIERINLNWLYFFLLSAGCLVTVFFILNILSFNYLSAQIMDRVDIVILFLWIFSLGYRSKYQITIPQIDKSSNSNKKNTSIKNKVNNNLYMDFLDYLKKSKIYLKTELTLPLLAQKTGIPRNELSQLINDNSGGNFYNLINRLRVERSEEYLLDRESNMTILDIAYEVGFNNKATFNNAFKKYNKCTPSYFRKSKNG